MKWKPRGLALEQAVLLVASILAANSVLAAERIAGPLQSPLSWRSVGPLLDSSAALDSARRSVGLVDKDAAPASIGLAVLTDRHPFGETFANRPVWIVAFPAVTIDRRDETASVKVPITAVIDPIDGRLLEAFTPAKDVWVPPVIAPRDPEREASEDGWSVSACESPKLGSTVAQVLVAFWKSQGVNPKNAGQIVLRPRIVACALPAVMKGNKYVPLRKPGPVWIVHVMGTVTLQRGQGRPGAPQAKAGPEYMSGLISLVDVKSLEVFRGVYLP